MIYRPFVREPRPGDFIRGEVRVPEGPPPRSAVVLVHGFMESRDWGFFPWLAGRLVGAGYGVASFDFSHGGGGSDPGQPTDLERFGSNTYSLELDELRAVLGEVIDGDLMPRRPRQVALMGHGRGGALAVLAAAAEPRVAALVTWAALSHFDRWTAETKKRWRDEGSVWVLDRSTGLQLPLHVTLLEDFEERRDELDVTAAATRVGAPWLIVHGTDDLSVWPGEAQTLARANPSSRLHLETDADHSFGSSHPFREPSPQLMAVATRTIEHLDRHVGDELMRGSG